MPKSPIGVHASTVACMHSSGGAPQHHHLPHADLQHACIQVPTHRTSMICLIRVITNPRRRSMGLRGWRMSPTSLSPTQPSRALASAAAWAQAAAEMVPSSRNTSHCRHTTLCCHTSHCTLWKSSQALTDRMQGGNHHRRGDELWLHWGVHPPGRQQAAGLQTTTSHVASLLHQQRTTGASAPHYDGLAMRAAWQHLSQWPTSRCVGAQQRREPTPVCCTRARGLMGCSGTWLTCCTAPLWLRPWGSGAWKPPRRPAIRGDPLPAWSPAWVATSLAIMMSRSVALPASWIAG